MERNDSTAKHIGIKTPPDKREQTFFGAGILKIYDLVYVFDNLLATGTGKYEFTGVKRWDNGFPVKVNELITKLDFKEEFDYECQSSDGGSTWSFSNYGRVTGLYTNNFVCPTSVNVTITTVAKSRFTEEEVKAARSFVEFGSGRSYLGKPYVPPIPINELRVGNWVYPDPHTLNTVEVTSKLLRQVDKGKVNLYPVDITESILAGAGFSEDTEAKYTIPLGGANKLTYIFPHKDEKAMVEFKNWMYEEPFALFRTQLQEVPKYLHQLQNLFFALSNKELKIRW